MDLLEVEPIEVAIAAIEFRDLGDSVNYTQIAKEFGVRKLLRSFENMTKGALPPATRRKIQNASKLKLSDWVPIIQDVKSEKKVHRFFWTRLGLMELYVSGHRKACKKSARDYDNNDNNKKKKKKKKKRKRKKLLENNCSFRETRQLRLERLAISRKQDHSQKDLFRKLRLDHLEKSRLMSQLRELKLKMLARPKSNARIASKLPERKRKNLQDFLLAL
ncbi:hypothetical protein N0V90_001898 [Kalmusia sp. IMI 367209]|nr:hypothetical protein N0V90_001898 [Kalmusia sp. IMI 367209]